MPTLSKGANTPMNCTSARVALSWDSHPANDHIDISALLLTDSGRVRSDDDFIFYNQPRHQSGAVAHLGRVSGRRVEEALDVQLNSIEADIVRVVFVASVDPGTFDSVGNLRVEVAANGIETVVYPVLGCTTEAALIAGELYRRADQWKFRAIGQGYDPGLGGIAKNFGITVDDPPPTSAASTPIPPPVPAQQASVGLAPVVTPAQSWEPPWYKIKSSLGVDLLTRLTLAEVAQTFKAVIRAKSRKAEFQAVEQLSDPFDQFNDNAEFAAVASASELTKMWAVQIYVYELGDHRGVTLRVLGDSGFARAWSGLQNSFSKTTGRKKADLVIATLRQKDGELTWLVE